MIGRNRDRREARGQDRRPSGRRGRARPRLETLENRQLLATFVVDSVLDTVAADGVTTLREAIEQSNATPLGMGETRHEIQFAITNPPGTVKTIAIQGSALPTITRPVWIHGYSQAGAQPNTLAIGNNAVLTIVIDGSAAGGSADGFLISTSDAIVEGLSIVGFAGSGIVVRGALATGNLLAGNFVGLDPDGTTVRGNVRNGVLIDGGASLNSVGGSAASARNVISGNTDDGVELSGGALNNAVANNYVGTNAQGTLARPNVSNGIRIDAAFRNEIGAGNLISGNMLDGVLIRAGASGNRVAGNVIGLAADGLTALGNGDDGVNIASAQSNSIGGPTVADRNVISGNTSNGVVISGAGANNNAVLGNRIGTNTSGQAAVGNLKDGLIVSLMATGNLIGDVNPVAGVLDTGNLISGNGQVGVRLNSVSGNTVRGNFIGTDRDGTATLPNQGQGVLLANSPGNILGGLNATASSLTAGNLISGNTLDGILIQGAGSTGNSVLGNFVGTTANGAAGLGNQLSGLSIALASRNSVGGSTSGSRNVFSGNSTFGIEIASATGNLVQGNIVGANATGMAAVANVRHGIRLIDARANSIGGANATPGVLSTGNLISGNVENGVELMAGSTTGNLIAGNFIGTNLLGTSALANGRDGVAVSGAIGNLIGGLSAGESNLLSGNVSDGIELNTAASGNQILGNRIGTNAAGTASVANQANGVRISGATTNALAANLISGNDLDGVLINNAASGNRLTNNWIGLAADGLTALGNGDDGVNIAAAPDNEVGPGNVLSGNGSNGVVVSGAAATGNLVIGNRIGTDSTGNTAVGNGKDGIILSLGATGTLIGGLTVADRNQISGNLGHGIRVAGVNTSGQTIQGNYIGTNAAGTLALGNELAGIYIESRANTVGGVADGASNLISGNLDSGVHLVGAGASGNLVAGNRIGTNGAGTAALANLGDGLRLGQGAASNVIGGATAEAMNLISGNLDNGISLNESGPGNQILGNRVGVNLLGSSAVANQGSGVILIDSPNVTIQSNQIAGNEGYGIAVTGTASTGNAILGNRIGINAAGTAALGNAASGVHIQGATGNRVADGNVISGNGADGVQLLAGADDNEVEGNSIGTNSSGTLAIGNAGFGLRVETSGNSLRDNLISGNGAGGVVFVGPTASGNVLAGNRIGTNAEGTAAVANQGDGVRLEGGAGSNLIGGDAEGDLNLISGNTGNGIGAYAAGSSNQVIGNRVGVNLLGSSAVANQGSGVILIDTPATAIYQGNLISGNQGFGIAVAGPASTGNVMLGNQVGTNASGSGALSNALSGIVILNSADNRVAEGNVISGNRADGVQLLSGASENRIEGNFIGTNPTGGTQIGNAGYGLMILGASGNLVQGNVLSGNGSHGVLLEGASTQSNTVAENIIGLVPTQNAALANRGSGIVVANGSGHVISGNLISGNRDFGVALIGAVSNQVDENIIGANADGTQNLGNGLDGLLAVNARSNSIEGNVVSFNRLNGLEIRDGSSNNTIANNYVGTDVSGAFPAPNAVDGIFLDGAFDNSILANVSSGNRINGIRLLGNTTGNLISGNRVGTNPAGTASVSNRGSGIMLEGASANSLTGNVASGNVGFGIAMINGASNNLVSQSRVGTDLAGESALSNTLYGVFLLNARGNTILNSLISANGPNLGGGNVRIEGPNSTANRISGSTIGANLAGTRSLDPNLGTVVMDPGGVPPGGLFTGNERVAQDFRNDGIVIAGGASGNVIGGFGLADRNLISGNRIGVFIRASSPGNLVAGNYIGTNAQGQAMPDGHQQQQGVILLNSARNSVGGLTAGARNVISGMLESGVRIARQDLDVNNDGQIDERRADASANLIAGNYIGTDPTGAFPVGNGLGVFIIGAAGNQIGAGHYASFQGGNLISGNRSGGIQVLNAATANARTVNGQIVVNPLMEGAVTSGNLIAGNRVGTNAAGTARVANGGTGIFLNDAPSNIVLGNLVSGNAMTGLTVFAPEATGNWLEGNRVGTDVNGALVPEMANGWIFANDPVLYRRGPGLFLNQTLVGATNIANNDLRGNVGGEVYERAITRGPSVQSVLPVVSAATGRIQTIEIVIDGYLDRDASRTLNPANYRVTLVSSGAAVPMAGPPVYDETGRRVTLQLLDSLSLNDRFLITVVGTQPNGLKSRPGIGVASPSVPLDGNGDGTPGDDGLFEFVGLTRVPVTPRRNA